MPTPERYQPRAVSAAAMRAPEWWPRSQQEAAAVDELLRQQVETTRQISRELGQLQARMDDMAARQDRHEATAGAMDAKLDRVLANQQAFGWVIKIGWMLAGACAAIGAWAWDHWPLFGGR